MALDNEPTTSPMPFNVAAWASQATRFLPEWGRTRDGSPTDLATLWAPFERSGKPGQIVDVGSWKKDENQTPEQRLRELQIALAGVIYAATTHQEIDKAPSIFRDILDAREAMLQDKNVQANTPVFQSVQSLLPAEFLNRDHGFWALAAQVAPQPRAQVQTPAFVADIHQKMTLALMKYRRDPKDQGAGTTLWQAISLMQMHSVGKAQSIRDYLQEIMINDVVTRKIDGHSQKTQAEIILKNLARKYPTGAIPSFQDYVAGLHASSAAPSEPHA